MSHYGVGRWPTLPRVAANSAWLVLAAMASNLPRATGTLAQRFGAMGVGRARRAWMPAGGWFCRSSPTPNGRSGCREPDPLGTAAQGGSGARLRGAGAPA